MKKIDFDKIDLILFLTILDYFLHSLIRSVTSNSTLMYVRALVSWLVGRSVIKLPRSLPRKEESFKSFLFSFINFSVHQFYCCIILARGPSTDRERIMDHSLWFLLQFKQGLWKGQRPKIINLAGGWPTAESILFIFLLSFLRCHLSKLG